MLGEFSGMSPPGGDRGEDPGHNGVTVTWLAWDGRFHPRLPVRFSTCGIGRFPPVYLAGAGLDVANRPITTK